MEKFVFKGTAKDFEDNRITLNGIELDQLSVNTLGKFGVLKVVGEGPKPARGRTPKLYQATSSKGFEFAKYAKTEEQSISSAEETKE